jgi:hypothetical protein
MTGEQDQLSALLVDLVDMAVAHFVSQKTTPITSTSIRLTAGSRPRLRLRGTETRLVFVAVFAAVVVFAPIGDVFVLVFVDVPRPRPRSSSTH